MAAPRGKFKKYTRVVIAYHVTFFFSSVCVSRAHDFVLMRDAHARAFTAKPTIFALVCLHRYEYFDSQCRACFSYSLRRTTAVKPRVYNIHTLASRYIPAVWCLIIILWFLVYLLSGCVHACSLDDVIIWCRAPAKAVNDYLPAIRNARALAPP